MHLVYHESTETTVQLSNGKSATLNRIRGKKNQEIISLRDQSFRNGLIENLMETFSQRWHCLKIESGPRDNKTNYLILLPDGPDPKKISERTLMLKIDVPYADFPIACTGQPSKASSARAISSSVMGCFLTKE